VNVKIEHRQGTRGQVAAELRNIRPPEPYKGKGIRYAGEQVRRKGGQNSPGGEISHAIDPKNQNVGGQRYRAICASARRSRARRSGRGWSCFVRPSTSTRSS